MPTAPALDAPATCAQVWRASLPSDTEIAAARRRLHRKAVVILALVTVAYWAVVISDVPVLARLGGAGVLVLGLFAVGTSIMHDANHGSFSRIPRLNRVLAWTSDALGASSWLWRTQHNSIHHGNTNVVGIDADIDLAPFARLAPEQPWRRWHRGQHVYMWPLYGFLALKNLLVSDVVALASGRIGSRPLTKRVTPTVVLRVVAGKLLHLGWAVVVPLLFNPWWGVLAFYLACSWLVGFLLAVTFQVAHCVDIADMTAPDAPRRGDDFIAHQLRTTVDVASPVPVAGHLFRWLVGGLDNQLEHHLAPRLPHTVYAAVGRRFREACAANGILCRRHPGVFAAVRSHARWLRAMSRPSPASASSLA